LKLRQNRERYKNAKGPDRGSRPTVLAVWRLVWSLDAGDRAGRVYLSYLRVEVARVGNIIESSVFSISVTLTRMEVEGREFCVDRGLILSPCYAYRSYVDPLINGGYFS
jgi:hypothetical protein